MNGYGQRLARLRTWLLWGTALLPAAFVALLIALRWPDYWLWINFENTPMTSLEVAVMFAAALVALSAGSRAWLNNDPEYREWWLLAAGFGYFALDDRFALHERLRDKVLIPHDIQVAVFPWGGPADFLLLTYAAIGLALLPRLAGLFGPDTRARRRLFMAVGVALLAVLLDSVDLNRLSEPGQRLEQTVEECLELTAQVLFLQAFLLAWLARLARDRVADS